MIPQENSPEISVIIVTFNGLSYTKRCLESIFATRGNVPFEIVVVDNASTDGTVEYLQELVKKNPLVQAVFLPQNKGFSGGNNEGLRRARGKYLLLLNNDTLLFPGWGTTFIRTFEQNPAFGLLGPVSNSVASNQLVFAPYKIEDAAEWVQKYTHRQGEKIFPEPRLSFFCVCIRREVYEKVGELDEQFGLGMFEDDDYCLRARNAGFRLGYTRKIFVHHFGSVSIGKLSSEDYQRQWNANRKYFETKWNTRWKPFLNFPILVRLVWDRRSRFSSYFDYFKRFLGK